MKTSRILELAGLPNQNAKLLEAIDRSKVTLKSLADKESKGVFDENWYDNGKLDCRNRSIDSLEGAPSKVSGAFDCSSNNLTSLEGAPSSVGGAFSCIQNKLASLKGAPKKVRDGFNCSSNVLTSLEGITPQIGGELVCDDNNLTSLHNIHMQIKHIGIEARFRRNPLKSHVLGLLLIDGLESVLMDNKKVQDIINKHLNGDRGTLACQEDLIEAGFEDFAQL